ncbi:MAG: EpsG family protein [Clostridiales bacterium]|nr:EpsG family protein [Clostridiales bacterium]
MNIYLFLFFSIIILGLFKYKTTYYGRSMDCFVTNVIGVSLFLVAALRSSNVGADTYQYCSHFAKIASTKIADLTTYSNGYYGDIEFGYKIYNKILSLIFTSPQTITIFNSLILVVLIMLVIRRDSVNQWLSVFLYFTFCFYQTALNLTPSSFVSYFMFLLYPFIKNRKWWKFLILTMLAMSFHTSAIFFIPLYFLSQIKVTPKRMGIVIIVGIVGTIFYSQVLPFIMMVIPTKYYSYLSPETEHYQLYVELLVYAVQLVAIIFCMFMCGTKKSRKFIDSNPTMCWTFMCETILYFFSTQSSMFSRGAFLFAPYTVIIIPKLLNMIDSKNKKVLATFAIVLFGVFVYIARISINNVGKTMPYQFFWD